MSGMGSPDEGALHAVILSENEQHRIRSMLAAQRDRISRHMCADCGGDIPERRRDVVPGCQYCVSCQPAHDGVTRVKMLTKML